MPTSGHAKEPCFTFLLFKWFAHWEEKSHGLDLRQDKGGLELCRQLEPLPTVLLSPGLPLGQQPGGGGVAGEAHEGGGQHPVSHQGEPQVPEAGLHPQAHPEVSACGSWDEKEIPGMGRAGGGDQAVVILASQEIALCLAACSRPTPS